MLTCLKSTGKTEPVNINNLIGVVLIPIIIRPGDVVSLLTDNGRAFHTLICVSYSKDDKSTTCYSHTGSSLARNLSEVDVPLIVYSMRD